MSSPAEESYVSSLLNLAAHEIRNAAGPGTGYLGFLTRYSSPLSEQQRAFVAESQKAWGKIQTLAEELELLARFKDGTVKLDRRQVNLAQVLEQAVAALPPPDEGRTVDVNVSLSAAASAVDGDSGRLKSAFTALLFSLRRELTSGDLYVRERQGDYNGRAASWIAIADGDHIDGLADATPDTLKNFEERRHGCGFKPPLARSIIEAHDGAVWSPADGSRAAAVLVLPH